MGELNFDRSDWDRENPADRHQHFPSAVVRYSTPSVATGDGNTPNTIE
jgi:hypothetical protein